MAWNGMCCPNKGCFASLGTCASQRLARTWSKNHSSHPTSTKVSKVEVRSWLQACYLLPSCPYSRPSSKTQLFSVQTQSFGFCTGPRYVFGGQFFHWFYFEIGLYESALLWSHKIFGMKRTQSNTSKISGRRGGGPRWYRKTNATN